VIPGTGGESTIYKLVGQERLWLVADHFEWLVARAIRTPDVQAVQPLWQEAQRVYRGVFLDSNRYQDWSQARRESLEADYRRLVLYVADLSLRSGNVQMADELLAPFVALHPTDEDALGLLLLVLEQQGRYHAAWRLYRRARGQEGQQDQQISHRLHTIAKRLREHLLTPAQPFQVRAHIDWGEAPQATTLYGRTKELSTLSAWITQEHTRLVAVVGMAGSGKTSLVVRFVEQVKPSFEFVLWRSLQNAPPLRTMLEQCFLFFSDGASAALLTDDEQGIALLLTALQQHRCLLVLDSIESLLQSDTQTGVYRKGYEGYEKLFCRLGGARHQSCVIIIGRELPGEMVVLQGKHAAVQVYQLEGLSSEDSAQILRETDITGAEETLQALVAFYDGNPLLLKFVAQTIGEEYHGDSEPFVRDGEFITDEMRKIFDQQFERLSALERELLSRIAKEPDGMLLDALRAMCRSEQEKQRLRDILRSLRRRFLIAITETKAKLSGMMVAYLAQRLNDQEDPNETVLQASTLNWQAAVSSRQAPSRHHVSPLTSIEASPSFPPFWSVPYQRNPFFTGREELLSSLHTLLHNKGAIIALSQHALCGLGGIGKTQTVLEYTYRYVHEYQAVFWVKADMHDNLVSEFASIASLGDCHSYLAEAQQC
jgi:hypothetical protein